MKIFIVYAHPSENSFTYQILQQLVATLKKQKHEIVVSDLYKMNFTTDMSENEYQREAYDNREIPIPIDILIEQEKLKNADLVCFVYPLWWTDCPAKMKGWFDRVYTTGFAYGYNTLGEKERSMPNIKYGLVITTAGNETATLEENGLAESMRKVMLQDRLADRFDHKKMVILGGTKVQEAVEKTHLETVTNIAEDIRSFFEG